MYYSEDKNGALALLVHHDQKLVGIEALSEKTLSDLKLRDHLPYKRSLIDVGKRNMNPGSLWVLAFLAVPWFLDNCGSRSGC